MWHLVKHNTPTERKREREKERERYYRDRERDRGGGATWNLLRGVVMRRHVAEYVHCTGSMSNELWTESALITNMLKNSQLPK